MMSGLFLLPSVFLLVHLQDVSVIVFCTGTCSIYDMVPWAAQPHKDFGVLMITALDLIKISSPRIVSPFLVRKSWHSQRVAKYKRHTEIFSWVQEWKKILRPQTCPYLHTASLHLGNLDSCVDWILKIEMKNNWPIIVRINFVRKLTHLTPR